MKAKPFTKAGQEFFDLANRLGFEVTEPKCMDGSHVFIVWSKRTGLRLMSVTTFDKAHSGFGRAVTRFDASLGSGLGPSHLTLKDATRFLWNCAYTSDCVACGERFYGQEESDKHALGQACAGCKVKIPVCHGNKLCVFCEGDISKGLILPLGIANATARFYEQYDEMSTGTTFRTWYRHMYNHAYFFSVCTSSIAGRTYVTVCVLRHDGDPADNHAIADSEHWHEVRYVTSRHYVLDSQWGRHI